MTRCVLPFCTRLNRAKDSAQPFARSLERPASSVEVARCPLKDVHKQSLAHRPAR